MKTEVESRITELRTAGLGYKRIANMLEIPVSTVKSFCYRNGLSMAESTASQQTHGKVDEKSASTCQECGASIEQTPGRKLKRFCSTACRMKWWHKHKDQLNHGIAHTRICAGCGGKMESYGNGARKYCGRSCYINHRSRDAHN